MFTDECMSFSPNQIRAAAVVAQVDPRTVVRFLEGEPIRELCRERLVSAFAKLGMSLPDVVLDAPELEALHDREPEASR
jgi:hypothetical protein